MAGGHRSRRESHVPLTRLNVRLELPTELVRVLDLYVLQMQLRVGGRVTAEEVLGSLLSLVLLALSRKTITNQENLSLAELQHLVQTLSTKELVDLDVFHAIQGHSPQPPELGPGRKRRSLGETAKANSLRSMLGRQLYKNRARGDG